MTSRRGKTIIQSGANVWPHEMKTAEALAAAGCTVEFIRRSEEQRITSADVIIGGVIWEMKAPKASNMKAVEKNPRKAMDQSDCVIFDSRRMKGIPDNATERELRVCAAGRVKKLRRLLSVNRKAQVVEHLQGDAEGLGLRARAQRRRELLDRVSVLMTFLNTVQSSLP